MNITPSCSAFHQSCSLLSIMDNSSPSANGSSSALPPVYEYTAVALTEDDVSARETELMDGTYQCHPIIAHMSLGRNRNCHLEQAYHTTSHLPSSKDWQGERGFHQRLCQPLMRMKDHTEHETYSNLQGVARRMDIKTALGVL